MAAIWMSASRPRIAGLEFVVVGDIGLHEGDARPLLRPRSRQTVEADQAVALGQRHFEDSAAHPAAGTRQSNFHRSVRLAGWVGPAQQPLGLAAIIKAVVAAEVAAHGTSGRSWWASSSDGSAAMVLGAMIKKASAPLKVRR